MSRIIMLSGIIKGKATSCCFVGSPQLVAKNQCNVAKGWVGCYAITIKMRREPAETSLTMSVTLRLGRLYPVGDLLTMTAVDGLASHMPLPFAGATGWFCDEGPAQRLPKLNFSREEEIASDQ
jgi:hypothetical protein